MFDKFLTEIGLSEKEAHIYLELLKVDQDSITSLSNKTGINRTTIYPVIEQLVKKGLVEEISNDNKAFYRAFSPDRIKTYIEQQQMRFNEFNSRANDMIPQLKAISREGGERPIVEYYEGKEAILKSVEDDKYSGTDVSETYLIYPRDSLEDIFSQKELDQARNIRIKKNIRSKSIYTYTKGDYTPDQTGDRFRIDDKKYPVKADIQVTGDRVYIHVFGKNMGSVFIRNKDISETLKILFKLAIEGLEQKKLK